MEQLWSEVMDLLRILTWSFNVRVHAFVLMSNHYHLLVSTPDANLDKAMQYFQSNLSRWVKAGSGVQKFRFGARYKWTLIKGVRHFADTFRYVYRNPVRAEMCVQAEDYAWSTLHGVVGASTLQCPIYLQENVGQLVPESVDDLLVLVNDPPSNEELDRVRTALRRCIFKYSHEKG